MSLMWKAFLNRYLSLAIMAALLWWDLRIGVFYLFVRLLNTSEHLDRLRAIVRVYAVNNQKRFDAIEEKLQITSSDKERVMKKIESGLTKKQLESLRYDVVLAGLSSE